MEIISIPLRGTLEHRDKTGGHAIIKSGEVQIMSAGSGLAHSEKNASASDDVNFLQIWVFPKERNIQPRYEQRVFNKADRLNKFQTVVSPEKEGGALWINQNAWFSLTNLAKESSLDYTLRKSGSGVYLFIIEGEVMVADQALSRRDGLGIADTDSITLRADTDAEVLIMEVPMN